VPVDREVAPLVVGRAAFGTVAFVAAGPLCRWTGITSNGFIARALGTAILAADAALIGAVVFSDERPDLRRAVAANAATDVVGAAVLLGLANRRRGTQRVVATLAGVSLIGGAAGWLRAMTSM